MVWTARNAAVALMFATLVSGSAIAAPTSQPDRETAPPTSVEDQKVEDLLDHHLPNVNLPGVSISDCIDFIRDVTGANIYVDWNAVALAGITKGARVDVAANDITVRGAFKKILEGTGSDSLGIQVMHGVIVVSTKLDFADRRSQTGPYLVELSDPVQSTAVLDKPLAQVTLPAVSLDDAYQYVQDLSGVPILMKWQAMAAAGIGRKTQVSLNLREAKLSTVLYFILDQAGDGKLGYIIEPTLITTQGVTKKTQTIIVSTVDDLEAGKANPTTQSN